MLGLAVLLATVLAALQPADPAEAKPRRTIHITEIAPGLTLTRIKDRKAPYRIFLLTVDPSGPLTIDVALANNRLPGLARTSRMARTHGAIAAVNGDFGLPSGAPAHPFAQDGSLVQTSFAFGQNFAISHDERDVFVAHPRVSVGIVETDSGETWAIDRWNAGPPVFGEVAAYTDAGGSVAPPPAAACAARLLPSAGLRWAPGQLGVTGAYLVERAGCSEAALPTNGGLVLAAEPGSDEALLVLSLSPGETVEITWSFGWRGVLDAIGGSPLLVRHGVVVAPDCLSSFCGRNPRTGVGVTADGKLLLMVVDGRQPKRSIGMTLVQFARELVRWGAVLALNLDGGGSSTMVVDGEVVNRPSDGRERRVSSALLVLPGPDPDEPVPAQRPSGALTTPSVPGFASPELDVEARTPAALDQGSTGGLLRALANGELGPGSAP